jgi:hypothetical protein
MVIKDYDAFLDMGAIDDALHQSVEFEVLRLAQAELCRQLRRVRKGSFLDLVEVEDLYQVASLLQDGLGESLLSSGSKRQEVLRKGITSVNSFSVVSLSVQLANGLLQYKER